MAEAETEIKAQIAILPGTQCELCEDEEIKWKCFTCEQYMCDHCKKIHQKVRTNREHRVTTIEGADPRDSDNTDEKYKCRFHQDEDVNLFCKECDVLICTDCIVGGSHKQHTISKTKDVISEKQRELSAIIKESIHKLSEFEQNMKSIREIRLNQSKDIDKCYEDVESKYTQLKAKLDQIYSEVLTRLKRLEKQIQEGLEGTEKSMESDMSELKKMIDQCTEKQAEGGMGLIQFVQNVKQKLKQFKLHHPPDVIYVPVFVSNTVDEIEAKALFGGLVVDQVKGYKYGGPVPAMPMTPTVTVRVVSSFNMDKNRVAAVNDNQAWVGWGGEGDRKLLLVTSDGKVVKKSRTDFDVYDLAVTQKGELLATVINGNKVKKLTSGGTFVDLFIHPSDEVLTKGITVTDKNDIILCLYNCNTKEGQLAQLTSTGQLKRTIKFDTDGKTMLFADPLRVSSNRNNDIIVTESEDKVVVVDESGKRRFTYTGKIKGLMKSFNPVYTVTDQYGHIIISDRKNSVVHLLDKDGNFIQFILSADHGLHVPYGLSVDTAGRLWLCSRKNHKIMVVKYV